MYAHTKLKIRLIARYVMATIQEMVARDGMAPFADTGFSGGRHVFPVSARK